MLTSETQVELWTGILQRLHEGEPLVTPEDFCDALDREHRTLTGAPLSLEARSQFLRLVRELHDSYPHTYLAQGVQNAVSHAFAACAARMDWGQADVESAGWTVMRRFLHSDSVRELLVANQLRPSMINTSQALRRAMLALEPGHRRSAAGDNETPVAALDAPPLSPEDLLHEGALHEGTLPEDSLHEDSLRKDSFDDDSLFDFDFGDGLEAAAEVESPSLDRATKLAAEAAGMDEEEAAERIQEQEALRLQLTETETANLPARIDAFVQDGILQAAEADDVRLLLRVDGREAAGEIDASTAEAERDQILTVERRTDVRRRLRKQVDATVGYLQVFDSLKRMSRDLDPLLKLLLTHKQHVVDANSGDRTVLLGALSKEPLLDHAIAVMERSDAEIRLLAVRLPPYPHVVPRRRQEISNLTVEPSFIDDLRGCTADDISERFRDPDVAVRARPAADILSFVHLMDHVIEPTPFRRKLRMLMANRILTELRPRFEELYAEDNPKTARQKADRVLRQRLERRFVDASVEEQMAAQKRAHALLNAIEQKAMMADDAPELVPVEDDEAAPQAAADDSLTEEEVHNGVHLARVEMRIAGGLKKVVCKLMPDPDDPDQQVICRRDPETGVLEPQVRRGKKRLVEQSTDGIWRAV